MFFPDSTAPLLVGFGYYFYFVGLRSFYLFMFLFFLLLEGERPLGVPVV